MAEMGILVMSSLDLTYNITENTPTAYGRKYNGVYSGLGVYAFDDIAKLETQLKDLDTIGKPDAVVAIWMYPKNLVTLCQSYDRENWTEYTWADFDFSTRRCANVAGVSSDHVTLALYQNYHENLFEGYKPVNYKLYAYPYNFLYVTSNQGAKAEFKFEQFYTPNDVYNFRLYGAISPDAGVKIAPEGYNVYGAQTNYDEGLTLANFPPCAWDSDTYKVWLAQNYNQLNNAMEGAVVSTMAGVGATVAGVATGNVMAAGAGVVGALHGYNQIRGVMAQKEDAKAQPPQAKGSFSSNVNVANGRQTFTFYYKSIRKEYAQQLDDYFTMYGYQINRVQVPNISARPAFTFVKTVGCQVTGDMSNEDITQIERIFDNGVTFWKDGDKIGDYSQSNKV